MQILWFFLALSGCVILSVLCGALPSLLWEAMHKHARLSIWFMGNPHQRAIWLALLMTILRYLVIGGVYAIEVRINDYWHFVTLLLGLPEVVIGAGIVHIGVTSDEKTGLWIAAGLFLAILYFFWHWLFGRIAISLGNRE